jgi:hypothetical protein
MDVISVIKLIPVAALVAFAVRWAHPRLAAARLRWRRRRRPPLSPRGGGQPMITRGIVAKKF